MQFPLLSLAYLPIILSSTQALRKQHFLSDAYIDDINSKQVSWVAGSNFDPGTNPCFIKQISSGTLLIKNPGVPSKAHNADVIDSLPKQFDAREEWPNCSSIQEITNQAGCSCSWAMSSVEVMTDRECIYSSGMRQIQYSVQDLITCNNEGYGCHNGSFHTAYNHWKHNGIVSGGGYDSYKGCRPFTIPPCDGRYWTDLKPSCNCNISTPLCVESCRPGYTNITYEENKHFGKTFYTFENATQIKAELVTNGPVTAGFEVYQDFVHYKSGIYVHTRGKKIGTHGIKIIGYGVDDRQEYWLCANSWGSNWGDHGFFKIQTGQGKIEDYVYAGEPIV